ncbi:hypothetical protein Bca101_020051 [Brassica carinata]
MSVVPGYSTRIENSFNAIQSHTNRENLPVLNPGPGDLLDKTISTWFRVLSDLSLVIPPILIDGWVYAWPTYRSIPDHIKERWFLQLVMRELKRRWAHGGDKPSLMLTRVWLELVHMFEEFGPDNFGFTD